MFMRVIPQVSRCEKFGYGVMVTQVAVTAPGVAALHSSGSHFTNRYSILFMLFSIYQFYARTLNNLLFRIFILDTGMLNEI